MKIISKYKDYYDYLSGVWGEDPKAILDRRSFVKNKPTPEDKDIVTLFICDYIIEGYYMNGRWWYGKELMQFTNETENRKTSDFKNQYKQQYGTEWVNYVSVPIKMPNRWGPQTTDVLMYPTLIANSPNTRLKTPILLLENRWNNEDSHSFSPYPILKDYNLQNFYSPEEIYLLLTNWLLKENPVPVSVQTNTEKIESHGFDKKTSFRPNMK